MLAGKTVAVKDNICVAGVPMMNGSRVLEGYVPEIDATVVTRVLEAGGTIAGKAACEDLCFSAGSHTCATGPIRNPHNPEHSTGGSSGGSAALVAAGEVDMALGGDQGGSIRTPSCWCGVYGLKPTWGLVPMTGGMPISYSVDHCGPMCGSTENVARLLTAIAGPDGYDPRTTIAGSRTIWRARQGREGDENRGDEGRLRPRGERPDTDEKVRAAIAEFRTLGATVEEVSVPMHYDGPHIWTAIILEGAAEMMIKGYAMGNNWPGYYGTSLREAFARGWQSRPDDVSETVKLVLLLGEYMHRHYHNRYHAKAQNLRVSCARPMTTCCRLRSHGHADNPVPRHQDPAAGLLARGVRRPRAQHAAQYLPVRRERPSGLHRALREGRRPAGRHDAGRPPLRRGDAHPRRPCVRADRGLARSADGAVGSRAERSGLQRPRYSATSAGR